MSLRLGGRCLGQVIAEGRPEPFCRTFTSQGEIRCLSVSVVAAPGGRSPWADQNPGGAG